MRGEIGKKWHDLGIELLDSNDIGELDTIDAQHSSDLNKCCTKMFDLWLKKQPTASWNQLIEALRQPCINLTTLAKKIEQMLKPEPKGQLYIRNFLYNESLEIQQMLHNSLCTYIC